MTDVVCGVMVDNTDVLSGPAKIEIKIPAGIEILTYPKGLYILSHIGFRETSPDLNGLYDGLVLPKTQYRYLWCISWLSLTSAIYAFTRGYNDLAFVPLGVWLTSINYWWKPDYSWRRYFDITYVNISLLYQLMRSIDCENRVSYWITLFIGCSFFPIGCYLHTTSSWASTLCHSMVHIFGNISNFILYSGEVPPPSHVCFA